MGVQDRAYMRGRGPPPIAFGTSWTLRFVVLIAAVFVLVNGAHTWAGQRWERALLLSSDSIREGRVWTLVTAALLHVDAWHLAFNLLGLWYFGKLVEETIGGARYIVFFFAAAVFAFVPYVVASFAAGDATPTLGASGIVMAMLAFAALRYPGMPWSFWGLPLVLWQLAALYVAIDVFGLISRDPGVNHWAHLGGAAFGWIIHRFGLVPNFRLPRRTAKAARAPGPFAEGDTRTEIDRLLDKISTRGIGSLSQSEREFLKRNSGRYR